MSNKQIEKIVNDYILEHVSVEELDYSQDILADGIVNSLFTIELMTFLEKTFEIKVTMDDLDMENFKSVNNIANFVRNKQEQGA